jgi:hypothetical protein
LNQWIHGSSFLFFFPAALIELVAGLEEAKNLAGQKPLPDQIRFPDCQALKKSRLLVKTIRRKCESPIPVPKRTQLFISVSVCAYNEMLSRRRAARQQSRLFAVAIHSCDAAPTSSSLAEIGDGQLVHYPHACARTSRSY